MFVSSKVSPAKNGADEAASGKGLPAIPAPRKKSEGRQGPGTCPDTVGWGRDRGYF